MNENCLCFSPLLFLLLNPPFSNTIIRQNVLTVRFILLWWINIWQCTKFTVIAKQQRPILLHRTHIFYWRVNNNIIYFYPLDLLFFMGFSWTFTTKTVLQHFSMLLIWISSCIYQRIVSFFFRQTHTPYPPKFQICY